MKFRHNIVLLFLSLLSSMSWASNQVSVYEDLIYWRASQETTSPWAFQQTTNSPPGALYTEPNAYFEWSPGVRAGVLYEPENYFDTKLYWTYFSTKAKEEITAPSGQFFLPEFFNGFTSLNLFNAAQLDWRLIMNMVDLEVGHAFKPIDSLILRPFVGVKGGTINQSINSFWEADIGTTTAYSAREKLKNNFLGLGPSFGIDGTYALFDHVNIKSDLSTALLWGRWNIQDTYFRPTALLGLIPQTTITTNRKNLMLGTFMARYFLGLDWTFQARATVTLKAGYEMQFWSNQLRLPMFQALPVHGDLTLQGGTCGILIKL
ncbi:Lpg1974 family pore-forming outer membrane protein [Legionella impletisoli]|uniref:Major outer membrane protein n=1 Tax=Legionella impletisoli TaxID=343510 RepID=A0A917JPM3_9GAMM|nr:Lpg1974 family pore-forming outer membrane protein [Legionella impletisoli]GGI80486.1 hypothetical protein GCM10007966_06260 [Legionella impletisoli]